MADTPPVRGFLSRPFWRDWVLGGVLLGLGFMLNSPGNTTRLLFGCILAIAGAGILLAALVHLVLTLIRLARVPR